MYAIVAFPRYSAINFSRIGLMDLYTWLHCDSISTKTGHLGRDVFIYFSWVTFTTVFLSRLITYFLEFTWVFSGEIYLLLIAITVDETRIKNTIRAVDTKTTECIFFQFPFILLLCPWSIFHKKYYYFCT